ncbi:NAD-dependent epimerase/dehydratase family protein [Halocatena halophila]|uniref:NAD-dependent epimerase/dehydratase family protein n=1 Tax=Halocatena halophila TaxID=2814576 RepID=UPI002ED3BE3A
MSSHPQIAVTGAAGYIGSCVIDQLQTIHPEYELTAIDNFYRGTVRQIGDCPVEHVDIRQSESLARALDGVDVVIHLAAISGVEDCDDDPDRSFSVNVQATNTIARWCQNHGAALAFPFSMAVLGDPTTFPITSDAVRTPLNWYGKSKVLGERAVATFADGAFPAHLFMISNVYGTHQLPDRTVSKSVVLNFFVERALAGKPLTVYEPGTQARNYVHVSDIARLYVRSTERLLEKQAAGKTGATRFAVGSDEDPSVMAIAELVQSVAAEQLGHDVPIELVENPRSAETLTDTFTVDTRKVTETLGWEPQHSLRESVVAAFDR